MAKPEESKEEVHRYCVPKFMIVELQKEMMRILLSLDNIDVGEAKYKTREIIERMSAMIR